MYNVNLKIGDLINKYQNICHRNIVIKIKLLSRNILNHLCNSKKIFAILLFKISQESFHRYFYKNKKYNCIEIFIVFVFLFSNQNHYFFFLKLQSQLLSYTSVLQIYIKLSFVFKTTISYRKTSLIGQSNIILIFARCILAICP